MISWMQKHNRYLVWTIWIATLAFIGAGFVGWGSYSFGSKAGNVAKVGTIEIPQTKLDFVYSSLYNQYNEMMQGKLDEAKAKEMGLLQQAFAQLETQTKLLNFAKDTGLIVSDEEVSQKLQKIHIFQKDGAFNKEIYDGYLRNQRLKPKFFEEILREELIIQKTLSLLTIKSLPLEKEAILAAMNVGDKMAYKILTSNQVDSVADETKIKAQWEIQKESFLTDPSYTLSIVWVPTKDTLVTDDEIKAHFEANRFNYTDATGKQLSFEDAKTSATKDLQIKNTKKTAQKTYIAFKKGEYAADENITLDFGNPKLTQEVWKELKTKSIGDISKPKIIGDSYAIIKIENAISSRVKTYEEAEEEVTALYIKQAKKEALLALGEKTLKNFDANSSIVSDFVRFEENVNLEGLNDEESLQFLQKLFTSTKEKGIISISDKVVVYTVLEQKLMTADANQTKSAMQTANKLKQNMFESNLIKLLDKRYLTETYVGGLSN